MERISYVKLNLSAQRFRVASPLSLATRSGQPIYRFPANFHPNQAIGK